jgi:helix-turn-helix protein
VPIGDTLAQARHRAGLTVTQVSKQTRIRETIIRKIEADDYSECGGDFYARGHIRAIAKATGADPEPLIQEYDTWHREPGAIGTVSIEELLAASGRSGQRHPPDPPAPRVARAGEPSWRAVRPAGIGGRMVSRYPSPRHTANWAAGVILALVVVTLGFVALHVLAGKPPAAAPSAAGKHATARRAAGPGQEAPAAKASHRAPASPAPKASQPAAPPAPPAQQSQALSPVRVTAFGPHGGDNPQLARLALASQSGGWHTDWYATARFGNLYRGTGLLLDMGHAVTITSTRIDLGNTTGASLQVRVGDRPVLAGLRPVAHASGAGGTVRLGLGSPARGRYVLVWFTRLPTDTSGTFQAQVNSIALHGRP